MEKILSRGMLEAIQQIWKQERNATTQESEAVMSAALALYDEVERLENELLTAHDDGVDAGMEAVMGEIEKLREKWKHNIGVVERDLKWQLENGTNNLTEKNIEITKNELKVLRNGLPTPLNRREGGR